MREVPLCRDYGSKFNGIHIAAGFGALAKMNRARAGNHAHKVIIIFFCITLEPGVVELSDTKVYVP